MKKIRECELLKFLAGLFLGLGMFFGLVFGVLFVEAYSDGYYLKDGEKRVKEKIIDRIATNYDEIAFNYYIDIKEKAAGNLYNYDVEYYENYFSEKNTNYMFRMISNEEENKGDIVLSNYTIPEAEYKIVDIRDVCIVQGNDRLSYEIDFEKIIKPVDGAVMQRASGGYYADDGNTHYYMVPDYISILSAPCNAYVVNKKNREKVNNEIQNPIYQEPVKTENVSTTTEVATYEEDLYATTEMATYEEDDYDLTEAEIYGEVYYEAPYVEIDASELGYEQYVTDKMAVYSFPREIDFSDLYMYEEINERGEMETILVIDDYFQYIPEYHMDFMKVKNTFLEEYKNCDFYDRIDLEYDYNSKMYTEIYENGYYESLTLERAVKTELTALDNFMTSNRLYFLPKLFDVAFPVFCICLGVCLITFIYLFFAVGHRKGEEGVCLNSFDKIPYDLVVVVYFLFCVWGIKLVYDVIYNYGYYRLGNIIAYLIPPVFVALMFPIVFFSGVTRAKVGVLFKNMVVTKAIKLAYRILKRFGTGTRSYIKYLRQNLNLYWKWVGGFILIIIAEFLMLVFTGEEEVAYFFFAADIVMAVAAIAIGAINMNKLREGARRIASGDVNYKIDTDKMLWEFKSHGETLNNISDGIQAAVNERMKSEHMQTELITNVTHDIKTPLTSIISYVDLLSREELNNEKADEYVDVLSRQSERLKKLIEDLIEASKATTGNIKVNFSDVDVKVLLEQSLAEFSDKLEVKGLKPVVRFNAENTVVRADGKHLWRVFDNLINNISKYAQENTRVYIDVERDSQEGLVVSFKNISKEELNISGDELMARFVRGDKSRNTEGNGLGLSIAKSLMRIQDGDMDIIVDGDLFKVVIILK